MSWSALPFLRLLIPFAVGVLLAVMLDFPLLLSNGWLAITAFVTAIMVFRHQESEINNWLSGVCLQLFILFFGYWHTIEHSELRQNDHFSQLLKNENQWWMATLADAPVHGKRWRVKMRVEAVSDDLVNWHISSGNALVYLPESDDSLVYKYGDRVIFQTKMLPIEPPANPKAFDFQRYSHFQNIHFQAFTSESAIIKLSEKQGSILWQWIFERRTELLSLLAQHIPDDDAYATATALLLGKKDELSDELRAAYQRSGSMHALAVSGMHVGIIFAGLMWLMQWLPLPARWSRPLESIIALLIIWLFAFLTGCTPSVLRASIMFSILLVGRAAILHTSTWNIWAAAAFFQLLFDPYALLDVGFQLSYSAVAGIMFFYPRFWRFSPIFKNNIKNWLWQGMLVGVSAQIATLPLTLFYFHQFPVFFWLSGWVVALLGAIFLYSCTLLLFFSWCWDTAAMWIGKLLWGTVWLQNKLIMGIESLPGSVVEGIWLSNAEIGLLLGMLVFAIFHFEYQEKKWGLAALILLAGWVSISSFRKIEQSSQQKMVIYQVRRQSLIDFFDGKNLYTFLSDTLPRQTMLATAQNFRMSKGVSKPISQIFLQKDSICQWANGWWRPPVLAFFDKKIIIIGANDIPQGVCPPMKVDIILLRNNPKIDLPKTAQYFDCQLFIADGSNSNWQIERWKKAIDSTSIQLHDTRHDGAWMGDFSKN